jgi:hypothetical protein
VELKDCEVESGTVIEADCQSFPSHTFLLKYSVFVHSVCFLFPSHPPLPAGRISWVFFFFFFLIDSLVGLSSRH